MYKRILPNVTSKRTAIVNVKKKNPSHGVFNRLEGGGFFSTYQNISGSYRDTEILYICVGESKSDSLLSFILFKPYFFTESRDHVDQQGPPKVMQSSLWSEWGQLSRLLKASMSPFTNSHIPVCVSCLFLFLCTSIFFVSLCQLQEAISCLFTFVLRLNRPSSFSFSTYIMISSPLTSLVDLHRAQSSISVSYLYSSSCQGAQHWTLLRCGLQIPNTEEPLPSTCWLHFC